MANPISKMLLTASFVLFLFLFLVGCGGAQSKYRMYTGPELSKNDMAIIKGFTPMLLLEVDGVPGKNRRSVGPDTRFRYNSWFDGSFNVELTPGDHELLLGYFAPTQFSRTTSKASAMMKVHLEAGKTYQLKPWCDANHWNAILVDSATGQQAALLFK